MTLDHAHAEPFEPLDVPADASVEVTHDGRLLKMEVVRWRDALGRDVEREIVRHPGAVVVVPVLDDGRLVLIHNARIAVGVRVWEFPAGGLEPGEPPLDAGRRELAEETGYRAGSVEDLGYLFTTPGICDEKIHVVLAHDLTEGERAPEPGEDMTVHPLEPAAIDRMVGEGELVDGKTLAALLIARSRLESLAGARQGAR